MDMAIVVIGILSGVFILASIFAETDEVSNARGKTHAFLCIIVFILAFVKVGANLASIVFAGADVICFMTILFKTVSEKAFNNYVAAHCLFYAIFVGIALAN